MVYITIIGHHTTLRRANTPAEALYWLDTFFMGIPLTSVRWFMGCEPHGSHDASDYQAV